MAFLREMDPAADHGWLHLAQSAVARHILWALCAAALAAACGSGGNGGNGGTGGSHFLNCTAANDGDPCDTPGQHCGVDECYGCSGTCMADGRWSVTCTVQPPCPTEPVEEGGQCDWYCGPNVCGPYTIHTACGDETLTAHCGGSWSYTSRCLAHCVSITDAAACAAETTCAWVVPCTDSVPGAGCTSSPMGYADCSDITCQPGTICEHVDVNASDPHDSDCSQSRGFATLCSPAPTP